jgi:hypothetical protein
VNTVSWVLIGVAAIAVPLMFLPRLQKSTLWRATVTPLASIIGSGFLLAGPVLGSTVGQMALPAMAGLIAVGYLFGETIRYNIRHVEEILAEGSHRILVVLDELADVALSLAYFVSIAYYINLFSAFFLSIFGVSSPVPINAMTTAMIAMIGVAGMVWGFRGLEKLIVHSVSLKLGLIAALVVALAGAWLFAPSHSLSAAANTAQASFEQVRVVLGLLILVQGFETSRYLGAEFDADTRVKSMRLAQLLSGVIYLVFIASVTPHFGALDSSTLTETSVIEMLSVVGAAFGPVLIVAALASQFSASIADTSGAAGLIVETTRGRVGHRLAVASITAIVIGLTWSIGIFQIVTLGSQAFVVYYALQATIASLHAGGQRRMFRAVLFGSAAVIGAVVLFLALPAA